MDNAEGAFSRNGGNTAGTQAEDSARLIKVVAYASTLQSLLGEHRSQRGPRLHSGHPQRAGEVLSPCGTSIIKQSFPLY